MGLKCTAHVIITSFWQKVAVKSNVFYAIKLWFAQRLVVNFRR